MGKRKKKADSDVEHCVVCGKPTEYCKNTPIDKRERYAKALGSRAESATLKFI